MLWNKWWKPKLLIAFFSITAYQWPSFVFSASLPALLAVSASEGINILRNAPSILETLQEIVCAARSILDRLDCITIPSHPGSLIIHIYVRQQQSSFLHPSSTLLIFSPKPSSAAISMKDIVGRELDYDAEERALQNVVEETLAQGVIVARAKRLKGQETMETRPSIRLAMTSALSKKETEKASGCA